MLPARPYIRGEKQRMTLWLAHLIETRRVKRLDAEGVTKYEPLNLDTASRNCSTYREIVQRLRALCLDRAMHTPTLPQMMDTHPDHHVLSTYWLMRQLFGQLEPDQHECGFDWQTLMNYDKIIAQGCTVPTRLQFDATKQYALPWRDIAALRFRCGLYTNPPWHEDVAVMPDHFAHVSRKDPRMIAYFPDEDKGQRDIPTVLKPGKYLTKFYPDLHGDEVRKLQAKFGTVEDIKFTSKPEEIVDIYVRHAEACMGHPTSKWPYKQHPVQVYGGGPDLQLAYMVDLGGKPNARALCWPDKKIYGRVYGDTDRLECRLQLLGYKKDYLWGARFRRVHLEGNNYVMPYIDGLTKDCRAAYDVVQDAEGNISKDYFQIALPGVYHRASHELGYIEHHDPERCACCNRRNGSIAANVHVTDYDHQRWCRDCVARRAFCSRWSSNYYPIDQMATVLMSSGACEVSIRERDRIAYLCQGSNQWYERCQYPAVTLEDGRVWSNIYFQRYGKFVNDVAYDRTKAPGEQLSLLDSPAATNESDSTAAARLKAKRKARNDQQRTIYEEHMAAQRREREASRI